MSISVPVPIAALKSVYLMLVAPSSAHNAAPATAPTASPTI